MKTKPFQVGPIRIKPIAEKAWLLRYTDPGTGSDVRRRLRGLSEREVQQIAGHLSSEILANDGYIPSRRPRGPKIAEAFASAIESRNTRKKTIRERALAAKRFIGWLEENHPHVQTWDELKPSMVQRYVIDLERFGLAFDSVRLYAAPIKLAWRIVAEDHPNLVRPLPTIKHNPAPPREIDCFTPSEVRHLLDWMREEATDLWPVATLQGLGGLRVLEATALRERDVDLDAHSITICATEEHAPKTLASWRTIPVCEEIVDALAVAWKSRKIRSAEGELFLNRAGNPWNKNGITLRWRRTLQRAARDLDDIRFSQVWPRKLRASFATMADRLGAPDRLLKAYLGHAAGDMLGTHYRRIEFEELKTVSSRMDQWRQLADCPERQESGNSRLTRVSEY